MSMLKKFGEFFVTIESDDAIPNDAASKDVEKAAKAVVDHVEKRAPSTAPKQRVQVEDPFAGDDFDIEALEAELASDRKKAIQAGHISAPSHSGSSAGAFSPKGFDDIYQEAGLPTEMSNDFTVYTIEQLLANPHLQNLPDATKRASLMVALQARKVSAAEVVSDARNRDHALDEHDAELMNTLIDLESATAQLNRDAEDRINALLNELREDIAANNEKVEFAKATYYDWKQLKIEEEKRLFDAISHLVEPGVVNPVSKDE